MALARRPVGNTAHRSSDGSVQSSRTRLTLPVGGRAPTVEASFELRSTERRAPRQTVTLDASDASVRAVGHGRWGWEALAYLQLRQFSSGFASVDPARTVATEVLDQYRVPSTGVGGKIELRPPLGRTIELALGGRLMR